MRARLAIATSLAPQSLELREVVLKDKPQAMLDASPKGTVPVLVLPSGQVLEESLDIMTWSMEQNSEVQDAFVGAFDFTAMNALIEENDGPFKWALDRYKYADRYEESEDYYRQKGQVFLASLETKLSQHPYLFGEQPSFADLAIFPFVRQFAHVDRDWFYQTEYSALIKWLDYWLASDVFTRIMKKYPKWEVDSETLLFPENS